jgi:hypothetical protein
VLPKPKPKSAAGLEKFLKSELLRAAVVGASCAAFPAACPAITALSTAKDAFDAARKVVSALNGPGGLSAAGKEAQGQVWQYLVGQTAAGAAQPAVAIASAAIASVIPNPAGVPSEFVRKLAAGTLSSMLSSSLSSGVSYAAGAR